MNAISSRSPTRRALFAALWLVMTLALFFGAGLRINLTPSLPQGVYRLAPGAPEKNDLVSFCLEGDFAEMARERGYLAAGSCPSGLRPLLKRLAGQPGDYIQADTLAVRNLDSQGRPIASRLQSGIIPSGMALLLADHSGSFDSRYFGLVPLEKLQRVKPVFIFNPQGE